MIGSSKWTMLGPAEKLESVMRRDRPGEDGYRRDAESIVANFEHRASSSRGKHEGESSFALCDRLRDSHEQGT
jgi:hypothetical protein